MNVEAELAWLARVPRGVGATLPARADEVEAALPQMRAVAARIAALPRAPSARLRAVQGPLRVVGWRLTRVADALEHDAPERKLSRLLDALGEAIRGYLDANEALLRRIKGV